MTDNVLDKLRQNRKRPSVPNREDVLIPDKASLKLDILKTEAEQIVERNLHLDRSDSTNILKELEDELAQIPNTVRHSAIVIDASIDKPLTAFCKENKITVELFLEAAWNLSNSDPVYLQLILADAKQRYSVRKRAGKIRRLITMLQK
jgi:hypothetical protein